MSTLRDISWGRGTTRSGDPVALARGSSADCGQRRSLNYRRCRRILELSESNLSTECLHCRARLESNEPGSRATVNGRPAYSPPRSTPARPRLRPRLRPAPAFVRRSAPQCRPDVSQLQPTLDDDGCGSFGSAQLGSAQQLSSAQLGSALSGGLGSGSCRDDQISPADRSGPAPAAETRPGSDTPVHGERGRALRLPYWSVRRPVARYTVASHQHWAVIEPS